MVVRLRRIFASVTKEMKLVIKVGGQVIEDRKRCGELARQIARLRRSGHDVVVVHGGGKRLTQTLAQLDIRTEFYAGLRVTDAATRDVALMVLAGLINKQWVAELGAQGQPALGLCGGDAGLVGARKLVLGSNGRTVNLGFVGRPHKVNATILELFLQSGLVPVVASLAPDSRGEYLNINADDLAAALAVALKADRLFYLTESGGVWDAQQRLLPIVRIREVPALIRRGIVRDGMIPKLRSCVRTLRQEVGEVDIVSPDVPNVLVASIERGESSGTRIVRS